VCRAALLILSDDGKIHPGPTIYDSFWVRDSSVEGMACALAGDLALPEEQFARHYVRPEVFGRRDERLDGVSLRGFFGGEHERQDREWDSNGQALWAFGRYDRVRGRDYGFGAGLFSPYVVEGARWIRDNRGPYGLLPAGKCSGPAPIPLWPDDTNHQLDFSQAGSHARRYRAFLRIGVVYGA